MSYLEVKTMFYDMLMPRIVRSTQDMFIEILSSRRAWSEWVPVESEGLDYIMSSWQPCFQEFQEFCICLPSVRASQRRTCLRLGRRKWNRSPYVPNARLAGHSHGRGRWSGCSGSALQTLAQLSSSLQPRPPPAAWLWRWGLHRSCQSLLQGLRPECWLQNVPSSSSGIHTRAAVRRANSWCSDSLVPPPLHWPSLAAFFGTRSISHNKALISYYS